MARHRTLREKWNDYAWYRDARRVHFDDRHPRLRWFPWIIAVSFAGVSAAALGFDAGNPLAGISAYLLGLVVVDFGMTAVAVLAWTIGRRLWREDADPRYLATAIGFAGLPVWGVLQTLCYTFIIPVLSESEVCIYVPNLSWLAVLWLMILPVGAVLIDFRAYLKGRLAATGPPTA